MQPLETTRLRLRFITFDDAPFILKLYNTSGFLRFVGNKRLSTESDAEHYIENAFLTMERDKGVSLLVVEEKQTSTPIGVCGLIKREMLDAYDVGYGFLPQATGKGYGTESVLAVIRYAEQQEHIDELVAITTADNEASKALLNKAGFQFAKTQQVLEDGRALLLYSLTLRQYD